MLKYFTVASLILVLLNILSGNGSLIKGNAISNQNEIDYDFQVYLDNPLLDADPITAPKISEYLDLTNLDFQGYGSEISLYDKVPPYPLNNITPGVMLSATVIISKEYKLVYYSIGESNGDGFRYFVNATHNFQVFTFPGGYLCYKARNYTYQNNINEYKFLRRSGSLRLAPVYTQKLNLKKQIDDLYGIRTRNCKNVPDVSIVDRYHGIINDASACGGYCGLQNVGTSMTLFISRYAKVCYGKNLLIQQANVQFYPTQQFSGSDRNEYQAIYTFGTFTKVKNSNVQSYINEIDAACGNAIDYPLFFNSECPFPNQPSFQCGTVKK